MKDMVKRWWILLAAIAVLIVAAGMLWHIVRSMPSLGPVLAYAEEPEADDAGKVPPGRILGKQVGYAAVIGTDDAVQVRKRSGQTVGAECTITPLEKHSYGGWSTNRFQVVTGGHTFTGYCAQPSKPTTSGTYPVSELKNDLIKFLLLCGEEGPLYNGYGRYIYDEDDHNVYAYAHAAISYAYCGDLAGLDANMGAGVRNMVEVAKDAMKADSVQKLMKNYTAYVAYNNTQDIVWVVETGPTTGYLKIKKTDTNTVLTKNNAMYSLAGAEFGVYKDQACKEKVGTLKSKADGTTDALELEAGTYYVREDKAPPGYILNTTVAKAVIKEEETATVTISNKPQCALVDLAAVKLDRETGEGRPLGGAVLSDAHFLIEFYAGSKVADAPTRRWILKTDDDGKAWMDPGHLVEGDPFYEDESGKIVLPLGTVQISEIKAPKGYLLNKEKAVQTLQATENGKTAVVFNKAEIKNQVIRGDLKLTKVLERTQERMSGIPFRITSKTTGESHVIMTDDNGYASTEASWNPHTQNTNQGESAEDGVWFGEGSQPDDTLGALPYDDYAVEELKCTANEGCELVSFSVSVRRDKQTIEGGTLVNKTPEGPSIGTTAYEAGTGAKEIEPAEAVVIVDAVDYEKLEKGKTYTLKGVLMDKDTGKPLMVDGKAVTAGKTFTAEKKSGTEVVSFSLNAKAVAGRTTVVFEKLLNESGEEIAAHEDINSKGQTIKVKGTAPAKTVRDLVMTGDYVDRSDYVFLMIIAGLVAAATFITRKRTGGF